MSSAIVLFTSVTSLIGFFINVFVLYLVISRGKGNLRFVFSGLLLIAACWDLAISLVMLRNDYPAEVLLYQNIVTYPILFFPAFVYHFSTAYIGEPRPKSTIALYAYCIGGVVVTLLFGGAPVDVYTYEWGTVARNDMGPLSATWLLAVLLAFGLSYWFLYRAWRRESSPVRRRHLAYVLVSLIVFGLAMVKVSVTLGVDAPLTLPLGMLLVDAFGALIGVAIVKDRLFDITTILKKGTIYTSLAALIVLLFAVSEHLITTYLSELAGGLSEYLPLVSVVIVVAAFMPLRRRLERLVEGYFSARNIVVEF